MTSSALLLLPPELRTQIYTFCFKTPLALTLRSAHIFPPLTRTNRQLRSETLPIYLSLQRLNAHLDDGPSAPLAGWLKVLGRELCSHIREVNVWDMHMLNCVLHGPGTAREMLRKGSGLKAEEGEKEEGYVLRPVGQEVLHPGWFLADVLLVLRGMGLGLERFCVVCEGERRVRMTSRFALVQCEETSLEMDVEDSTRELGLNEEIGSVAPASDS